MRELENSKSIDYGNSIFEKKSWKQIILIVGLLLYVGSLVVYLLINLSFFDIGLFIIGSDSWYTVGAIRVTTTGIATILIATGLLSLRKNQEIQKKKIIASAVLFLLIVPLKMSLEMILYNYLHHIVHHSFWFWFFYFVTAISLFTDFVPYFIATTIINSNIIQIEQKLKTILIISTVFQALILLFTIIIAILYSIPSNYNMVNIFFACTLIYGCLGIIMSSQYLILLAKWRRKINIKSEEKKNKRSKQ